MRVLLVEDSERLRDAIGTALRNSQYAVDTSADGKEGLWLARANHYDTIILDIMLPGMDGLTVLREFRDSGGESQVLLLTAKDSVPDRVFGLRNGADDYLVKPFVLEELLARVDVLCRRKYGHKQKLIEIGSLCLRLNRKQATRNGEPLELTPREYRLLEYLAARRGQVVSRQEIEAHIYDDLVEPMSNVVDSAICALRKKIGGPDAPPLIHTRRGLGYLMEEE
ncbi:MAG TPA: response regulator transcription factor [Verrucomicrobiae bacterium]|nr:response regulator transcription factor [Verrucomicrobiae bacterium]